MAERSGRSVEIGPRAGLAGTLRRGAGEGAGGYSYRTPRVWRWRNWLGLIPTARRKAKVKLEGEEKPMVKAMLKDILFHIADYGYVHDKFKEQSAKHGITLP